MHTGAPPGAAPQRAWVQFRHASQFRVHPAGVFCVRLPDTTIAVSTGSPERAVGQAARAALPESAAGSERFRRCRWRSADVGSLKTPWLAVWRCAAAPGDLSPRLIVTAAAEPYSRVREKRRPGSVRAVSGRVMYIATRQSWVSQLGGQRGMAILFAPEVAAVGSAPTCARLEPVCGLARWTYQENRSSPRDRLCGELRRRNSCGRRGNSTVRGVKVRWSIL